MEKNTSVQGKLLLSVSTVVIVLMGISLLFMAERQKQMVQILATEKARDIANSYFDGINTMMLTGSMTQSQVLREKLKSHAGVVEVRLIRGQALRESFGAGSAEQMAEDEADRQALSGRAQVIAGLRGDDQIVTVIEPVIASANYKGTNCLTCHAVSEGTVLGAVRVSYSLNELHSTIQRNLVLTIALAAVLLAMGVVLIGWLMRKIVVEPLSAMRDTMNDISRNADLRRRLHVESDDEIGQLGVTFNTMLDRFCHILNQVSDTSSHLSLATQQISRVAHQTTDAASQQYRETESVLRAIQQFQVTLQDLRLGAGGAAQVSIEADQQASTGATTTKNAIDGIYDLVNEIERASEVIKRLDEKSKGVSSVLDVIKGLAEQTNLLALNAAIEAARAGDQGRGFAVVADEVRTLATRSHHATEEIESIIDQLQREAKDAVEVMINAKQSAEQRRHQVQSADQGLNLIADKVTQIRKLNAQMADTVDEQSQTAQQVGESVANIGRLTQHTAQDAQQTSAASQELVNLATRLNELVAQFKR